MLLLLHVDKHHLFRVVYSFYDYKRCIEDTFDANGKYVNNLLSSKETFVEMRESESRSKINISICQLQIVKNIKSNIIIYFIRNTQKDCFGNFQDLLNFLFLVAATTMENTKIVFILDFSPIYFLKHTWQINAF